MTSDSTASARPLGDQLQRGREEARSIGREIGEIIGELRGIGQLEVELARADVMEQVSLARSAAMWGAVAGVFALMVLVFALLTTMFGLAEVWPLWLAALATTGIALLIGAVVGFLAYRNIKQATFKPQRSIQSLQRDMQWAREQTISRGS